MKITNSLGLSCEFLANGSLESLEVDPIRINLKLTTPFSRPGTNLYLRKRGKPFEFTPLLGPQSDSVFKICDDAFVATGSWANLHYNCILELSKQSLSWQWSVQITNRSDHAVELDLIYVQDAGLKALNAGLINEYYVSQYLERRILHDGRYGAVACCRQNMKEATGHPWFLLACRNGAQAGSTDGMQFYGKKYRATGVPEGMLTDDPWGEYAGESSVFALQEKPFRLACDGVHNSAFVGAYLPDHPQATSEEDLKHLPGLCLEFNDQEATQGRPDARNGLAVQGREQPVPVTATSDAPGDRLSSPGAGGCPSSGADTPQDQPENSLLLDLFSPSKNIFNISRFLPVDDLNEAELSHFFGNQRRHAELENGRLLSFFSLENHHVVLRAKELLADRPHAHIMQARAGYVPDESIMSTTAFAFGVFHSHLTQGNTNFNVLLSVCTSQFNLAPETGQRIFVEIEGELFLLGVPSAFEMGLNHCRWIYKHGQRCFQVRSWTSKTAPQVNTDFKVISGSEVRLLISHDFDALNDWTVSPARQPDEFIAIPGADSPVATKFAAPRFRILINRLGSDYQAREVGGSVPTAPPPAVRTLHPASSACRSGTSLFLLEVGKTAGFCVSFIGEVCSPVEPVQLEDPDRQWASDCDDAQAAWRDLGCGLSFQGDQPDIQAIREILPWYGLNALTHFLTPYGLEQFSGAAWGTRDVSQGPIDLLLNLQKYDAARRVLCLIFSNQNPDGGWPQWWMFDRYQTVRASEAHGDIHYWCLIALANYLKVTGDLGILDDVLPYFREEGSAQAERTPLREHVDRLIKMIADSFIPGTAFVPFDGGDWNDSLQPVSKELARRMISSWTVEMNYQAFSEYQWVYEQTGETAKARKLKEIGENIRADFNQHLFKDDVVAGYGLIEADQSIRLLLHPTDTTTGIRYSILPMNRGIISGMFTSEQARHHQDLIETHLKGPDGARLMDRPLQYKGGVQTIFQRAESSTFFGREIGLMYMHEHIRYAESLARTGKADAFLKALRQAIPVGYRGVVPCSDIRQSNCYYTSSDVVFRNRYEADARYPEIKTGKLTLRGGWRVYSSGPGIYIGLIVSHLLGLRLESGHLIIDPVMPHSLDGLSASLDLFGHKLTWKYAVKERNFSPKAIVVNGKLVPFSHEANRYRSGGAVIPIKQFRTFLSQQANTVQVQL